MKQTMTEFIKNNNVTMTFEQADSNPYISDMPSGSNHYKVTIKKNGKQFTTYYSQGPAIYHGPEIEDVLNCLALDSLSFENARDFEDFANEFGYDTDSRRAEKIYRACEKTSKSMHRLFSDYQLEELYQIGY